MYGSKKTLLDVLRLGLQSENPELRDTVITYIAIEDLIDALQLLENYVTSEEFPWIAEYANRVISHLKNIAEGKASVPPIVEDVDTTVMDQSEQLELRWKCRFPELEE